MNTTDILKAWNKAELNADREAIAQALTDDFTAIGPLGFTLSKQDWLNRHGPLRYEALDLTDITTKTYGDVTVAIATQTQQATFNGNPVPATNRLSIVLTGKKIANIHFSFIAGTEGAPKLPGR
jgi:hypothetical protein